MSKRHITLLTIDPQNDFCDPKGALFVTGADQDMKRLAAMVRTNADKIDSFRITLDSHHLAHIAHPVVWQDANGNHPAPFTMFGSADVKNGTWSPVNPAWRTRVISYLEALEANGRYPFIIWNPHCLIGSWGTAVVPELRDAIRESYETKLKPVDWVTKGSHYFTEHYSAVQADVPDPRDPSTQINTRFVQALQAADDILISGEALSHCVANTIRDVAAQFGDEHVKKFVLLTDASSPVGDLPGSTMFKDMADAFVKELTAKGMRLSTTTTFFA